MAAAVVLYYNRIKIGIFILPPGRRDAAGYKIEKELFIMDHRVTVTICGNEYTFVAEEDSTYVEKVAEYVDRKMTETLEATKAGQTDAAVLTAANIADELFKAQEIAENLRVQLKEYLDEASRSKNEISELKREIFKLQNQR